MLLQILGEYTGGNDFVKAQLPTCLSRLKNLEALFMANCNLKGQIPIWIAELTGFLIQAFLPQEY